MPGRDGSGPLGEGAMTGRGFGDCPSGTGAFRGLFGYGAGLGRGVRGFGCGAYGFGARRGIGRFGPGPGGWFHPAFGAGVSRKEVLSERKSMLERQLEEISRQLADLSEE